MWPLTQSVSNGSDTGAQTMQQQIAIIVTSVLGSWCVELAKGQGNT